MGSGWDCVGRSGDAGQGGRLKTQEVANRAACKKDNLSRFAGGGRATKVYRSAGTRIAGFCRKAARSASKASRSAPILWSDQPMMLPIPWAACAEHSSD